MIPVSRSVLKKEPVGFDEKCRKKGAGWLARNPKATRKAKRPKDFWSPFRPALAEAFTDRCAYSAMYEPNGTVDHFKPVNTDESLAYEWSNYRYVTGWINSSKNKRPKVLDAFQVKAGWFEVLLPSLQLVAIKANIPPRLHALVDRTLNDLHLVDDERIVRLRREWLRMYEDQEINLEGLRKKAPLIAAAIEKRDAVA
ncbi:hypothetical protein LNV23_02305 [Paucibacter sp. DJ1R-11]|uniref:hypothetical protein n=1 Tax=Paucibacter sp. DJ1R-11 TaxID=2893556 RepID=UPI0021E3F65C|nr:hypothetical protein [Paucibacter sp. DJ1R-11]MCV2362279.1 hypothetical protein [Paucibacter sp. DJ1R-11]